MMLHVADIFNNVIVFWPRHTFLGASGQFVTPLGPHNLDNLFNLTGKSFYLKTQNCGVCGELILLTLRIEVCCDVTLI